MELLRPVLLVVGATAAVGILVLIIGAGPLIDYLRMLGGQVTSHPLLAAGVLFAWSGVLFLTVLPFGTATILVAGALLGAWAGWIQFASLLAASVIVFETGDGDARQAALARLDAYPRLSRLVVALRARGVLLTALLRLAPVVPSAVCCLACSGLAIRRREFLVGTISVGWIRPVAFAAAGAATPVEEVLRSLALA